MALEDELHIKSTTCLLCRQPPDTAAKILDLDLNVLSGPQCTVHGCSRCYISPLRPVWLHEACLDILNGSFKHRVTQDELRRFHDATKPMHEDKCVVRTEREPCREGLFSECSRNIVDGIFRQDLLRELPLEILDFILDYAAPCWYLIVLGETRRLIKQLKSAEETQCLQINFEKEIWISRTYYCGVPYVSRISGTPLGSTATIEVHYMKLLANVNQIVLSMDSTAIRGIQPLDGDSRPTSDGSPWYKILNLGIPNNGGLFVRDIELRSSSASIENTMWSSPFQPKFQTWNFFGHKKMHRLQYLPLDCETRGLMVCCVGTKMIGIQGYADTPRKVDKFVEWTNQRLKEPGRELWIFFPLNAHEQVLGAWIRHRKGRAPGPFFALILHTCLGRTVTFGAQYPSYVVDGLEYHPLLLTGEAPITGLFHDGLDTRIRSNNITEIGITCAGGRESGDSGPPPLPANVHSEPPGVSPGSPNSTWFLSRAPLKSVSKMQLCRDIRKPYRPVMGVLVFYEDQHVESLGQMRWDFDVNEYVSAPFYIRKRNVNGWDCVLDIRSSKSNINLMEDSDTWERLPLDGTIVWWFSRLGDKIITYKD
ncbi:uncharacterized protein BDV14DRAFT_188269 [Aspergillus stella-maris]|uniref:uncharacterized protein n=1 Tax=Aspergillus stella-maris TaxID=1810926 RepID=UPI003CCD0D0E